MPVDDRTRLNLHRKLDAVLGPEEADTLMAHLPPVTWNEIATKSDIVHATALTRAEIEVAETSLRSDIQTLETSLRSDIQTLETSLRSDIQTFETSLRSDIATVRSEVQHLDISLRSEMRALDSSLRAAISDALTTQTKWMMTVVLAWSAVLITAVRLVP